MLVGEFFIVEEPAKGKRRKDAPLPASLRVCWRLSAYGKLTIVEPQGTLSLTRGRLSYVLRKLSEVFEGERALMPVLRPTSSDTPAQHG